MSTTTHIHGSPQGIDTLTVHSGAGDHLSMALSHFRNGLEQVKPDDTEGMVHYEVLAATFDLRIEEARTRIQESVESAKSPICYPSIDGKGNPIPNKPSLEPKACADVLLSLPESQELFEKDVVSEFSKYVNSHKVKTGKDLEFSDEDFERFKSAFFQLTRDRTIEKITPGAGIDDNENTHTGKTSETENEHESKSWSERARGLKNRISLSFKETRESYKALRQANRTLRETPGESRKEALEHLSLARKEFTFRVAKTTGILALSSVLVDTVTSNLPVLEKINEGQGVVKSAWLGATLGLGGTLAAQIYENGKKNENETESLANDGDKTNASTAEHEDASENQSWLGRQRYLIRKNGIINYASTNFADYTKRALFTGYTTESEKPAHTAMTQEAWASVPEDDSRKFRTLSEGLDRYRSGKIELTTQDLQQLEKRLHEEEARLAEKYGEAREETETKRKLTTKSKVIIGAGVAAVATYIVVWKYHGYNPFDWLPGSGNDGSDPSSTIPSRGDKVSEELATAQEAWDALSSTEQQQMTDGIEAIEAAHPNIDVGSPEFTTIVDKTLMLAQKKEEYIGRFPSNESVLRGHEFDANFQAYLEHMKDLEEAASQSRSVR